MSDFAQINYSQRVGNGPYTIAQVGCLLTAFCNLLTDRFGKRVDPATLNNFFIARGLYLLAPEDGKGVRDDLGWGSVSAYDGAIHVSSTGKGWPTSNNAIVEFRYKSQRTGEMITHFSLVADHARHMIVDSYDGKVKVAPYGEPVAFATYTHTAPVQVKPLVVPTPPKPVTPPAPLAPPKPANIIFTKLQEPLTLVVNKSPTHKWDLGFVNDAHATSVGELAKGAEFVAVGKAQRTDGDKPVYFMNADDFGNADQDGTPNHNFGVNTVDLSPKPIAPPTATVITGADGDKINVTVVPTDPNKWQQSYTAFMNPQIYIANKDEQIEDLAGLEALQQLSKGTRVNIAGAFDKDGYKYYRTVKSVQNEVWYGLPVDSLTKEGDLTDEELDALLVNPPKVTIAEKPVSKLSAREKLIVALASFVGGMAHVLHIGNKK